jgi:hypothetical protein
MDELTRRQELIFLEQRQLILWVRAVLCSPLEAVLHIPLEICVHAAMSWRCILALVVQVGRIAGGWHADIHNRVRSVVRQKAVQLRVDIRVQLR